MRDVYQGRARTELGNTHVRAPDLVTWLTILLGYRTHLARPGATVNFWRIDARPNRGTFDAHACRATTRPGALRGRAGDAATTRRPRAGMACRRRHSPDGDVVGHRSNSSRGDGAPAAGALPAPRRGHDRRGCCTVRESRDLPLHGRLPDRRRLRALRAP